jgi:hypothetical protein
LQPGHDAITRWGLLRGPARDFAQRTRYFGLLQVLPYLRSGTRVLSADQDELDGLSSLAVRTASGTTAIFLVNQSTDPIDLHLDTSSATASQPALFALWRTDRDHKDTQLDPIPLTGGRATVSLPPRSLTTLIDSATKVS